MNIKIDDLTSPEIKNLLEEHLQGMKANTPAGSVHALDIEALRAPDITFWSAWDGGDLMGCAALKEHNPKHVELKSMRTATAHLRKGVAKKLLQHILQIAEQRRYTRISLETGAIDDFIPARTLYTNAGFTYCKPFANYTDDDPNSVFMTKTLNQSDVKA